MVGGGIVIVVYCIQLPIVTLSSVAIVVELVVAFCVSVVVAHDERC